MKHLVCVLGLLLCCCGTEEDIDNTLYEPNDECLNCGYVPEEEEEIKESSGYLGAIPNDISFFCFNFKDCQDIASTFIINTKTQPAIIYGSYVDDNNENFIILNEEHQYPVILKHNEKMELKIKFILNTKTQYGDIIINTSDGIVSVSVLGKVFMDI